MDATAIDTGSAILMARIVDRCGVAIQPQSVAEIRYSIYVADSRRPGRPVTLHRHNAVPLAVDEVMFESLQFDASWSLDVSGYNFRHQIDFGPKRVVSRRDALYEACYLFTPIHGDAQVIRFQWRCGKK